MSVKPIKPNAVVKPISPKEIKKEIPDEVLNAFNTLITKNFDGKSSIVYQDDVVKEIMKQAKASGSSITTDEIFKNNWLDVEDLYRKEGWRVDFDQPAYCETYRANFTFTKKGK